MNIYFLNSCYKILINMSSAHQAPQMETINVDIDYAFSLSPNITGLYITEEEYVVKIQNWYKKILQQLYDDIRFMDFYFYT